MIDVHGALATRNAGRPAPSRMILTVHDELLFEAPAEDAEAVAEMARSVMENAFPLNVPLTGRRRNRPELEGREALVSISPYQTFNNRPPTPASNSPV
jgi:hypothetical protein